MDPLAHTLTGACLAETGLRHRTPLATATLILGANAPDIDATATLAGQDTALLVRRGLTHGVLGLALLPVLLTGVMLLYDQVVRRRRDPDAPPARPGWLLALAYASTLTHPALDWLNTYGVRLLMPFEDTWFYGDALFIVDPWVWLLLAGVVVMARARGRPSQAAWIVLGAATTALVLMVDMVPLPAKVAWLGGVCTIVVLRLRGARLSQVRRAAVACLAILVVYGGAMVWGTEVARAQAERWLHARGHRVGHVMAGPLPANPFVREVIAVTPGQYRFITVRWLGAPRFEHAHPPMPGDVRDRVVRAALEAPSVRGLRTWMRFPSYEVQRLSDGYRVTIRDVRYSRSEESGAPLGTAVVELDEELAPR